MARVRNFDEIKKALLSGDFLFVTKQELHKIHKYANNKVVQLSLQRIKTFANTFPEHEIAINEKYRLRYALHNKIIKKFVLTPKLKRKKEFHQLLLDKIGNINSFVDVSCGDNGFLNTLVDKLPQLNTVVGNDISRTQIDLIHKNHQKILYTNHNAVHLPFKEKTFDIAYCANTLHHMTSRKDIQSLLRGMYAISKKILIVEIERPQETGWFPHILNKYRYIGFLKDV
ncbi:MAG: class I SAM-dependent methyltransferase [bacterium]